MRLGGHYQPPTIKYRGREQLKSAVGSYCWLCPLVFWQVRLQSASCLTPAPLLHLGPLGSTARYAYGVSASASKIAATQDALGPVLHTMASGGHRAMGTACDALESFLFFFHRSTMLPGYTHPGKSGKVSYISSVQIEAQPLAIL